MPDNWKLSNPYPGSQCKRTRVKGFFIGTLTAILVLASSCMASTSQPSPGPDTPEQVPAGAEVTTAVPLETENIPAPSPALMRTENLPAPSPTSSGIVEPAPTSTRLPLPTLGADDWQNLPVIPNIGARPAEIYRHGLELGNNPNAFSKIGDCGSTPSWFLGDFDKGPRFYNLGEYTELEGVIAEFQGSYGRTSLAAKSGFNASSVFAPLWTNREFCDPDETPLGCEYRVHKPSFAFIMLGTNDIWHLDKFEEQIRKIIEFSIENGVVPILSTKADNNEGDHEINATIARLALEYDVPLWNYWLAVQPLPDGGLQPDGAHITWGPNQFDDPANLKRGWPVRNLTALQVLDRVWRNVNGEN